MSFLNDFCLNLFLGSVNSAKHRFFCNERRTDRGGGYAGKCEAYVAVASVFIHVFYKIVPEQLLVIPKRAAEDNVFNIHKTRGVYDGER